MIHSSDKHNNGLKSGLAKDQIETGEKAYRAVEKISL